jgi:hypothetical protein
MIVKEELFVGGTSGKREEGEDNGSKYKKTLYICLKTA